MKLIVIRRGTKSGINWYVARNQLGMLCAYLHLQDAYAKLFRSAEDVDQKLFVHGGCTYFENHFPWEHKRTDSSDAVVGWDYGHAGDIQFIPKCTRDQLLVFNVNDDEVVAEVEEAVDSLLALGKCS